MSGCNDVFGLCYNGCSHDMKFGNELEVGEKFAFLREVFAIFGDISKYIKIVKFHIEGYFDDYLKTFLGVFSSSNLDQLMSSDLSLGIQSMPYYYPTSNSYHALIALDLSSILVLNH